MYGTSRRQVKFILSRDSSSPDRTDDVPALKWCLILHSSMELASKMYCRTCGLFTWNAVTEKSFVIKTFIEGIFVSITQIPIIFRSRMCDLSLYRQSLKRKILNAASNDDDDCSFFECLWGYIFPIIQFTTSFISRFFTIYFPLLNDKQLCIF